MDLNLTGKRVLITGGSKGIGLAIGQRFASEGCDVWLASRSTGDLEAAAKSITEKWRVKAKAVTVDMAHPGAAATLVQACPDIDILVNNAGDIPAGNLEQVDEAKWRAGWDAKVFGYINLSREFFRIMKERRSGVIVNLSGIGGDLLDANYIAGSVGNASVMAFTKALGSTSHQFGVRVVAVNPGPVATGRLERLARAKANRLYGDPERWQESIGKFPFGRAATPDEVAAAVVFLASPLSGYTTGTILTIDGGITGGREIP
jgi:NAD(P)-dependent dehydrogenase (short-subunit alcohol dehydrogenase family)